MFCSFFLIVFLYLLLILRLYLWSDGTWWVCSGGVCCWFCKPRLRPKSLAALFPPFSPPSITDRQHLANICPQLGPRNQRHGVGSAVRHHRLLQPLRQHANVPRHRLLTAHRLKRCHEPKLFQVQTPANSTIFSGTSQNNYVIVLDHSRPTSEHPFPKRMFLHTHLRTSPAFILSSWHLQHWLRLNIPKPFSAFHQTPDLFL